MVNNMLALSERETEPLNGANCGRILRGSRFAGFGSWVHGDADLEEGMTEANLTQTLREFTRTREGARMLEDEKGRMQRGSGASSSRRISPRERAASNASASGRAARQDKLASLEQSLSSLSVYEEEAAALSGGGGAAPRYD